jgi:hypothetical protein
MTTRVVRGLFPEASRRALLAVLRGLVRRGGQPITVRLERGAASLTAGRETLGRIPCRVLDAGTIVLTARTAHHAVSRRAGTMAWIATSRLLVASRPVAEDFWATAAAVPAPSSPAMGMSRHAAA